jgi:glycosyltransferase involved in cell wall biosynthesis
MNQQPTKPSISFIVPALNEQENIEAAVKTVFESVGEKQGEFEIVLVNDGSTDKTGEIMERLAKRDPRICVVHNGRNLGFGGAFKSGLARARLEYVIRICGDNGVPAPGVKVILDKIGEADLVIPYIANPEFRSWSRRFGSWGFTTIVNTLFGLRIPYYNHSAVFRRKDLAAIQIATDSFAYQAEALIKILKAGHSYVVVGVNDIARVHGQSTALKPKNLVNVVRAIVQLFKEIRRTGAMPTLPQPGARPDPRRNV